MGKRITSIVLALVMVSALLMALPTTAYAAGDTYATISASGSVRNVKGGVSAVVKSDNTLWAWGDVGWFGDIQKTPQKMMDDVISVSVSAGTIFAIKTDGSLWGMGYNAAGQIGDGTMENRHNFVKIMDDVVAVSANVESTVAIKSDATLWAWGGGYSAEPEKIMDNVADASLGFYVLYVVKTDGTLWVNETTMLMEDVASVSTYDGEYALALKNDGTVWTWGSNTYGRLGNGSITNGEDAPIQVMDNAKAISAGRYHATVIKKDGTLWAWGANSDGQLGVDWNTINQPTPIQIMDDVATVSAGGEHTLAMKTDSTLWAWGNNRYNQIGDGEGGTYMDGEMQRDIIAHPPKQVMGGIKQPADLPRPVAPGTLEPVTLPLPELGPLGMVAAGHNYLAALRSDNSLWTWGSKWAPGWGGQTGHISIETPLKIMENVVFISASNINRDYLLAIQSDGSLWVCLGENQYGEYRPIGDGTNEYKPEPFKIMDNAVYADAGIDNAIAITTDSTLWAWGQDAIYFGNSEQQLSPVKIMSSVKQAAVGNGYIMAILSDNSLWVCGRGYLGVDGIDNSKDPIKVMDDVVQVHTGMQYTLVLKTDGSLWAWGRNDDGQLGDGSAETSQAPIKVMDNVVQFDASSGSSLAIKTDGTLWMWGRFGNNIEPVPVKKFDNIADAGCTATSLIALKTDGTIGAMRADETNLVAVNGFSDRPTAPQATTPGNTPSPSSNRGTTPGDEKQNSGLQLPLIIGGVVLVIGAVIAVIVIVSSEKKKKRN